MHPSPESIKFRGKGKLMSFMLKLGRNLRGLERVWENMQAGFVMVIFHVCNVVGVFFLSEQTIWVKNLSLPWRILLYLSFEIQSVVFVQMFRSLIFFHFILGFGYILPWSVMTNMHNNKAMKVCGTQAYFQWKCVYSWISGESEAWY